MAITITGNRILDSAARRGKARADAEARQKAAKAKSSGKGGKSRAGGGRSRTNSKARAGRASSRRGRGRGIAGSVHKSRAGGGASIAYATDKPESKFVSSNAGLKSKDIAEMFKLASSSRRDIIKNTGHESFSLPPGQKLSDEKWADIIDLVRQEKGLDDGFPFVAALHEDTDHQHAHFVFSRVSYDGRVVDDRFSKVRMAKIEDLIEDKFQLKLVPKPPTPTAPLYTKNEAEQAQRTGVQPARFMMFAAITAAKKDKPDVMTFVERLKADGIIARPAIKTGKMSGWSFEHQGVELSGSKIHNSLGWANLQKGIDYDEDRDAAKLADHAAGLSTRATDDQPDKSATHREIPIASQPVERPADRIKIPEQNPGIGFGEAEAKPLIQARRTEVPQANTRLVNRGADAHIDGVPTVRVNKADDPITKKLRARQAIIDRLRLEIGEQHKLAQELATRMEHGDLYRQREVVKKFAADHKTDPRAAALVKMHMPESAPNITPSIRREPAQELPERLRLADHYVKPIPTKKTDYQFPAR